MSKLAVHTGTSGFYNKSWVGIFYPEGMRGKDWFTYYCKHFSTFEINTTFYKFPTLRIMQNWYNRAPEGFIYAVKAPKVITHLRRFANCETEIAQFYNVCCEGLAEKLGPVLFQLPPSFSYSEERLNMILEALNPEFDNVVEFRNVSWWREDVYSSLAAKNITFCSVSYPKLPEDIVATTALVYVRLHGSDELFYSEYSPEYVSALANKLADLPGLNKAFVFFNNTASTAGIINAVQFKATMH